MNRGGDKKPVPGELRRRAEKLLSRTENEIDRFSRKEIAEMVHELRVHQIELELQNEELRRTRAELEGSHRRYFDLYDLAPVGYFTLDKVGLITECNLKGADLLGQERSRLAGKYLASFLPPSDRARFREHLAKARNSGQTEKLEIMIRPGQEKPPAWVLWETEKVLETGDGLFRTVATEITFRKRVEQSLAESEERYRLVVERANDGIVIIRDGKIIFANRKMAQISGFPLSRLLGSPFLNYVHPSQRTKIAGRYRKRMAGKNINPLYESTLIRQDGSPVPAEINAGVINFGDGPADLVFIRDITIRKKIESIQREEDEKLRGILDAMTDLVSITSPDLEVEYINPAMRKTFGPVRGQKCHAYLYHRKQRCPWCRLPGDLQGKTVRYEWTSSQNERTYDVIESPLSNPDESSSKLKILRDITEIKGQEKELRNRVEEIDLIYQNAPIGLCLVDTRLRFLRINQRLAEINGLSVEEHRGQSIREVIPGLAEQAEKIAAEILRTGKPVYDIEFAGRTLADPNKTHYWIEHWSPLKNSTGEIIGINISAENITERRELENRLKKLNEKLEEAVIRRTVELGDANELLEKIFSSVHFLLAYLDPGFNFIRVNRAYADAYDRPPEFFVGKNHFELFPHRANEDIFKRVATTGQPFVAYGRPFSYPDRPEKGTTYWDWSLRPIQDKRGEVEGLLLILVEVTEQKVAEEKLKRSRKKMADMERLAELGTLASMVAHEMRTPLATIRLAADNLDRKTDDPNLTRHIRSIANKVKASNRIITDLLDYSRMDLPRYRKFSILPLVRECLAELKKIHPEKTIAVRTSLESLQRKKMEGDRDQIRQVFRNIIENALDVSPPDNCRLDISARIEKKRTLVLQFRDNGPGLSEDDLKQIFTPFFTRKPSGTGLGLVICRDLLRLHDGSIEVKNAPRRGAVVTVKLPLRARDSITGCRME